MKLCLKITAGLLLLVQVLHLASLQPTTDSPGQAIPPGWLRKNVAGGQNPADFEVGNGQDQDPVMETSNDFLASGFIDPWLSEEEENVAGKVGEANNDDGTAVVKTTTLLPTDTTEQPEVQTTTILFGADRTNTSSVTDSNDTFLNPTSTPTTKASTTDLIMLNITSSPDHFNQTDLKTTTLAPEINATEEATTRPEENTGSMNATESTTTTTVPNTTTPETYRTSTVYSTTTVSPSWTTETSPGTNETNPGTTETSPETNETSPETNETSPGTTETSTGTTETSTGTTEISTGTTETSTGTTETSTGTTETSTGTTETSTGTTETSPETTTAAPLNTSSNGNDTDKASGSGSSAERGVGSDESQRRHSAWGTILGTAVAVICVGLVAFVILRHKHQKGFSHRKLVEEFPSDPVLRLDNNEPLDLNFGGSAYYNPALQGDNIQMSNFPGHR